MKALNKLFHTKYAHQVTFEDGYVAPVHPTVFLQTQIEGIWFTVIDVGSRLLAIPQNIPDWFEKGTSKPTEKTLAIETLWNLTPAMMDVPAEIAQLSITQYNFCLRIGFHMTSPHYVYGDGEVIVIVSKYANPPIYFFSNVEVDYAE